MTAARLPTAATRVYALLGDPVSHSLSPIFQNAALAQLGLDAVYVTLRCDAHHTSALMAGLARAGGGGNVTLPHKATALGVLQRTTAAVDRTGACNTFWFEDGRVCGDNTDVAGFRAALYALVPDATGATVLLLGAGGAARSAITGLLDAGAGRIVVHNRTPARAAALVQRFEDPRLSVAESVDGVAADIVVNATSLGLRDDDALPVELHRLPAATAVLDLVYRAGGSALVREAARSGLAAADGTEMLLRQGAAAFERWWGREAPLEAMRRALAAATR